MNKFKKAMILAILAVFLLACNLPFLKNNSSASESSTQEENNTTSSGHDSQTSGKNQNPAFSYNLFVPTRAKISDDALNIPWAFTNCVSEDEDCETYVVLDNTSTDSVDIVSEFNYTMTWYDENNKVLDQWERTFNDTLIPQEKFLFKLWPDNDKIAGHPVASAVFEITQVTHFKSFWDPDALAKLAQSKVDYPLFIVTAGDFKMDTLMGDMPVVTTHVSVQNNLSKQVGVIVVGLYLNEKGELIGVGQSDGVAVDAGASGDLDVAAYNLTEQPARGEYFAGFASTSNILEDVYPDYFK